MTIISLAHRRSELRVTSRDARSRLCHFSVSFSFDNETDDVIFESQADRMRRMSKFSDGRLTLEAR